MHNLPDLYAHFAIGWFYKADDSDLDFTVFPQDCRTVSLQELAAQILHLPYKEIKPRVSWGTETRPVSSKYICIGPHSTAACKE